MFSIKEVPGNSADFGGGLIGTALLLCCYKLFSINGTTILLVILFIITAILIIPLGVYRTVLNYMKETSTKAFDTVKKKTETFNEERKIRKAQRLEEEERKREVGGGW